MGTWTCSKCGKEWESDSDCERVNGKPVCTDCFYKELGEGLENAGIVPPKGGWKRPKPKRKKK